MSATLDALDRVHVFPVRHHSPRSSAVLSVVLDEVKPDVVLVEGPSDADALVDALVDRETAPPVAILGYRTDGTTGSILWPFATYSPEYVALAWAAKHRKRKGFIDRASGVALLRTRGKPTSTPAPSHDDPELLGVEEAAARALGLRSFEEAWEATIEAPRYDPASFRAAILAYADVVRVARHGDEDRARDALMTRRILEHVDAGTPPEKIVAVVGAAHAAAFAAKDVDPACEAWLPEAVPTALTIIPFSFPRLAGQLGYGAGNRAPQYYQRAHDAGCSYRRAALEVLVELTEHLRLRGYMASLSDTIEAYRLATTLASIRGKSEPGLDEVREATIATMCRGEVALVDDFLWRSVIGRRVGKVAAKIGKNSLQEEFWRTVEAKHLPSHDDLESFTLKLVDAVQAETSVFLHRLRVAEVPYAVFLGKHVQKRDRRRKKDDPADEAGGVDALSRLSEAWEACWTPATDVALVEKIVLGESLEIVATRVLDERLAEARSTGEAAGVLLEGVVASAPATVDAALAACDRFAAIDDDLPSLASACRALSSLVAYGSSRARSSLGDDAVRSLCRKTFDRAVLRATAACACDDDAAGPIRTALRALHEVALVADLVDGEAWFAAARELAASFGVNPSCAGLAAGLLYLAQRMSDDDLARHVSQRLGDTTEPARAASFLEGFLEVSSLAIVKLRPVVEALDAFLTGLEAPRFRDALPILRRALGALGATERRYLVENVLAIRAVGAASRAAMEVIAEKDKEKLQAMSAELDSAMGDLDDLL